MTNERGGATNGRSDAEAEHPDGAARPAASEAASPGGPAGPAEPTASVPPRHDRGDAAPPCAFPPASGPQTGAEGAYGAHSGPAPVAGAWGFPHPAGQPTVGPYAGTPHMHPAASYAGGAYGHPYGFPVAPAVEERREPVRFTWRVAAGLVAIALAAGALGGGIGTWVADRDERDVTLRQPVASGPERPRDTVAGLAATTLPGVVYIHASKGGDQASGTGFVLDGGGYILTNNHVVAQAADGGTISVVFNGGETVGARIVGRDTGYDLAVIRVEHVRGLVPLPLGNSDTVQVGDPVIAIGAPYNLAGTVTSGIISAKDRAVSAGGVGADVSYISALQTDAPINPGNSGGPLIDASGSVIGVNSAIRAADSGGGETNPFGGEAAAGSIGLGFAIPINQAKRVAQQLIDNGKAVHPVIGVTLDMDYDGAGARISDKEVKGQAPVRAGGPAARAGLRPGDVVTAVDGRRVADANELIVAVRAKAPGDTVALAVRRDGQELSLRLTLEGEGESG